MYDIYRYVHTQTHTHTYIYLYIWTDIPEKKEKNH